MLFYHILLHSNTPNMKVTMGGHDVPFNKDVKVGELLAKMHEKARAAQDDDDDDENVLEEVAGKKRKRKRGKAL